MSELTGTNVTERKTRVLLFSGDQDYLTRTLESVTADGYDVVGCDTPAAVLRYLRSLEPYDYPDAMIIYITPESAALLEYIAEWTTATGARFQAMISGRGAGDWPQRLSKITGHPVIYGLESKPGAIDLQRLFGLQPTVTIEPGDPLLNAAAATHLKAAFDFVLEVDNTFAAQISIGDGLQVSIDPNHENLWIFLHWYPLRELQLGIHVWLESFAGGTMVNIASCAQQGGFYGRQILPAVVVLDGFPEVANALRSQLLVSLREALCVAWGIGKSQLETGTGYPTYDWRTWSTDAALAMMLGLWASQDQLRPPFISEDGTHIPTATVLMHVLANTPWGRTWMNGIEHLQRLAYLLAQPPLDISDHGLK